MRPSNALVGLCVTAMSALGACGGGNVMCGGAVGCGGDIVGSWAITSDCAEPSPRYLEGKYCDTAYSIDPGTTGTFTYNADLTFTESSTRSGIETTTWPASCFTAEQCASLQNLLTNDPSIQTVTCRLASSCSCMIKRAGTTTTFAGTYATTAAGLLTLTLAGQAGLGQYDYCVNGNTLTLSPHPGGLPVDSSRITLTKL
jgi:hypothetical protein